MYLIYNLSLLVNKSDTVNHLIKVLISTFNLKLTDE